MFPLKGIRKISGLFKLLTVRLIAVGVVLLCIGVPRAFADDDSIERLMKTYPSMTGSKKELVDQLAREFTNLAGDSLKDLVNGSRYGEVETFVEALRSGEDVATLDLLAREIRFNDQVAIRFLAAMSEKLQKDPASLRRLELLVDELSAHLEEQEVEKIPWRMKVTEHVVTASGLVGTIYGVMGSYGDHISNTFLTSMPRAVVCLSAYIVMGVVRDALATVKGWKSYWGERSRLDSAKRTSAFLKTALDELQKSEEARNYIERLKFATSSSWGVHDKSVIASALEQSRRAIEGLQASDADVMAIYSREKRYLDVVKQFKDSLSQVELEELSLLMEGRGNSSFSAGLAPKVAYFERKTAQDLADWMKATGQSNQIQLRLAHSKATREREADALKSLQPSLATQISAGGLTLGMTIYGFQLSFGREVTPIDRYFFPQLIEWMRTHDPLVVGIVRTSIIAPLVYGAYEFVQSYKDVRLNPRPGAEDYRRFRAIADGVNRVRAPLRRTRMNSKFEGETPNAFVDRLLSTKDFSPKSCREIFAF